MPDGSVSRAGWGLLQAPLRAERPAFYKLGGWSIVEAVPVMLSGHLVARALDTGFLAGQVTAGLVWLLIYGACLLLGSFAARQAVPWVAAIVESARDALVQAVVAGGLLRAVRATTPPDTSAVARTTRQTEVVRDVLAGLLLQLRTVVFSVGAAVVGLVTLVPQMVVVVLPAVAVSAVGLWLLMRALVGRQQRALAADERVSESVGGVFGALRDIVACGGQRRAAREVGDDIDEKTRATVALARLGSLRALVVATGARVPLLVTLALAPWFVARGTMSAGEVVGVATYLVGGLEPALRSLTQVLGQMGLQLQVVTQRLAGWIDVPALPSGGPATPERLDITVEDLTFTYGPYAEPVFERLSLHVPDGDHVAVVGPSGIGKSTLASLLARVVEPQKGRIRVGGVDLAEIDETWLRSAVAVLPQESYVFAGTLRENLCYLRPDATDDQVAASVAALDLEPLVDRLGGYDTVVEHPSSLSTGERQRITLARAHLSPARVVILDEATCHLDPSAERRAEEAFMRRGGTLIVVAHRISSALRARRVLILEGGGHAIGDHETLMTRSRLYADLVGHWSAVG
jgi:ATP-binding cassette, subfamily C, bacterial